ncbi:copper homeostasis membrane protein CopD [Azorhizobium oxalatiphilum]|nr:copper homeostasis membrane protein CopD [Azorhizobium oxalatiphilum]
MDFALAGCRLCFYLGVVFLFGAGCFVQFLTPPPLDGRLEREIHEGTRTAALLVAAASLAFLPLQAAVIGDSWGQALDPATLAALAFDTSAGHALLLRVLLALGALALALGFPYMLGARLLLAALLLLSLAWTGHAAMEAGARHAVHVANHSLHLLSGAFWIGALPMVLLALRHLEHPTLRREAVTALRRFSLIGHLAVALVVATGLINSVLIIAGRPIELGSLYVRLLAIKVSLVALMIAIAIVNRYVCVPRLRSSPERAVRLLRHGTIAEIGIGITVLTVAAALGILDPAS